MAMKTRPINFRAHDIRYLQSELETPSSGKHMICVPLFGAVKDPQIAYDGKRWYDAGYPNITPELFDLPVRGDLYWVREKWSVHTGLLSHYYGPKYLPEGYMSFAEGDPEGQRIKASLRRAVRTYSSTQLPMKFSRYTLKVVDVVIDRIDGLSHEQVERIVGPTYQGEGPRVLLPEWLWPADDKMLCGLVRFEPYKMNVADCKREMERLQA